MRRKPVEMYNCLTDEVKMVMPPDLEMDCLDSYKESYNRVRNLSPLSFNRRRGNFSHFLDFSRESRKLVEKTKPKKRRRQQSVG